MSSLIFPLLLALSLTICNICCDAVTSIAEDEIFRRRNSTSTTPHRSITINQFQDVLFTEIHDEVDAISRLLNIENEIRSLVDIEQESILEDMWNDIVQHGWSQIEPSNESSNRSLRTRKNDLNTDKGRKSYPFLICNRSRERVTGALRRKDIVNELDLFDQDLIVVYNGDDQTCFHASATIEESSYLKQIQEHPMQNHNYAIVPMIDIMKINVNTIAEISQPYWPPGLETENKDHAQWERLVRVSFTTGVRSTINNNNILSKAEEIISYAQSLGKQGAEKRKLQTDANEHISHSITDMFSLTSSTFSSRRLNASPSTQGRSDMWTQALEQGLEATHGCKVMFERMEIKSQHNLRGFDITLNPIHAYYSNNEYSETEFDDDSAIDSSTSNVHCITSLIMALSTHSSVLNVEIDSPLVNSNDYGAKLTTQGENKGKLLLADAGLTGKGQVVSIIDSGCDINHRLFGPTKPSVMDDWDISQRKIISYDTYRGDSDDAHKGHGTAVASVVAGKANQGDTNANGIAEDAKLHIYDLSNGFGHVLSTPISPRPIFESMYNNGKGAKIANASYATRYSVYKTSCIYHDDELYGDYQDILFVASVGNSGTNEDGKTSRMMTIGNPAACKNTMAVGASQSTGNNINSGDSGNHFLAMFSSRGPTADNRRKPDIIAPGYDITVAKAHASDKEIDTEAVAGTSFAAPVVAGNAALVRQYFEEGWFPCGSKGCNVSVKPCGSLMKATIINGGQNIKRVHSGEYLTPYDNSQGMGLLNVTSTLPIGNGRFSGLIQNNVEIRDRAEHTFIVKAITQNNCRSPELSTTLAWHDGAGTNGCTKCLLNDLDVFVQRIKWNGKATGTIYLPNGTKYGDHRNNVERVRFNLKNKKKYKITVKAKNLSDESIQYSLIATGCFKVKQISTNTA